MIQELLYTSFEGKGLRKGGGGFCTVLSTEGMASNTASMLEKLCGYKHPFSLQDPRSEQNPVNYRFAIVNIGGEPHYVLSRIADYRKEHTGRTNKLAHHVSMTSRELPPGGPTQAFLHNGFSRSDWDHQVRLVPEVERQRLPNSEPKLSRCTAWEQLTGDAGWAGVVADALLSPTDNASIIFPLGADTLQLAHEVYSLLPSEKRWQITFSTYYTAAIPGSTCNLRFLLDGTSEAENFRRDHRQTKFDLSSLAGAPNDSLRVSAARTGDASQLVSKSTPPEGKRVARPAVVSADLYDDIKPRRPSVAEPVESSEDEYGVEPPSVSPQPMADVEGALNFVPPARKQSSGIKTWLNPLTVSLAAAVVLLMCTTVVLGVIAFVGPSGLIAQKPSTPEEDPWKPSKEAAPPAKSEDKTDQEPDSPEKPAEDKPEHSSADAEDPKSGSDPEVKEPEKTEEPEEKPAEEKPKEATPTPAYVEAPASAEGISFIKVGNADTAPVDICVDLREGEPVSLELIGLEQINRGRSLALGQFMISSSVEPGAAGWSFPDLGDEDTAPIAIRWKGGAPNFLDKQDEIGEFKVVGDKIVFQWLKDAGFGSVVNEERAGLANALAFCLLRIEQEGSMPRFVALHGKKPREFVQANLTPSLEKLALTTRFALAFPALDILKFEPKLLLRQESLSDRLKLQPEPSVQDGVQVLDFTRTEPAWEGSIFRISYKIDRDSETGVCQLKGEYDLPRYTVNKENKSERKITDGDRLTSLGAATSEIADIKDSIDESMRELNAQIERQKKAAEREPDPNADKETKQQQIENAKNARQRLAKIRKKNNAWKQIDEVVRLQDRFLNWLERNPVRVEYNISLQYDRIDLAPGGYLAFGK